MKLAVLVVTVVAAGVTPAAGREFFVSPTGDDLGPGTIRQPWRSLAKANAALQPGDTVILHAGEYEGVIEPATSGREGARITYCGPAVGEAILRGGKSSDDQWTCVRLKEREHILIQGLSLQPTRGGWMKLDSATIARGFVLAYRILGKVIEHKASNEFLRTKEFHSNVHNDFQSTEKGVKCT